MPRSHSHTNPLCCAIALSFVVAACGDDQSEQAAATPVTVYATREADAMRAVLDAYTENTGSPVLLTTESGRALIDRLSAERHKATADLILADGIGHLWRAAEYDVLRPSRIETPDSGIAENLRDPEMFWFPILAFARTIAYDKQHIGPEQLTNYAALGEDQWKGQLCLSSATDVDNQAHISIMIGESGERPAELTVRAWIANLAMPVVTDSRELLNAIEDGRCRLGIVNTDDLARFNRDQSQSSVAGYLPRESSGGAYMNIVGAAVTRHASNPGGALQLLEWLLSEKGQMQLAGQNLEVPVMQLDEWSALQMSPVKLAEAGYHHEDAVKLMERAHYGGTQ